MKPGAIHLICKFFKTWFLPQPSHDEQFPDMPKAEEPIDNIPEKQQPIHQGDAHLETAAEMERRAAREPAPDNLNLNEVDFSGMVQPPEGAEDRSSRSSNPFARSKPE